jgi:hypothetical protein
MEFPAGCAAYGVTPVKGCPPFRAVLYRVFSEQEQCRKYGFQNKRNADIRAVLFLLALSQLEKTKIPGRRCFLKSSYLETRNSFTMRGLY